MRMIGRISIGVLVLVLAAGGCWAAAHSVTALAEPAPLVLRYDKNRSDLNSADRNRLEAYFLPVRLTDGDRIFVVGYTDSQGSRDGNLKLSRARAERVRKAMIDQLGLRAENVIAIGRGAENPLGDNRTREGRGMNRRVEIFLAQAAGRTLEDAGAVPSENVDQMIAGARSLLKSQRLEEALRILRKAKAVGADRFSDWHALYGIAGFYGKAPLENVRLHLQTALQLDADNADARDFLGRVEARQRVISGQVTAAMGRSPEDPIPVTTLSQQHEYLKVFGIEVHARHELPGRAIEVWEGRDAQQQPIAYYFNHTQVHAWAFNGAASAGPGEAVVRSSRSAAAAAAGPKAGPPSQTAPITAHSGPRTIWESDLFK